MTTRRATAMNQSPAKSPRLSARSTKSGKSSSSSQDKSASQADWQLGQSLPSSLALALSKRHLSDVRFEFDEEETTLEAHKLLLSVRSPVFEAMLYGPAAEQDQCPVISIVDARSSVFSTMLTFIYTDHADIDSENALELLCLSHKYRLDSLTDVCCAYLARHLPNLSVENVLTCLQSAVLLQLPLLKEHCLMSIDQRAKEMFDDKIFLKISQDTLNVILVRDSLNVHEFEIYHAALDWAKAKCLEQKMETTGDNLRIVLGPTTSLFRFPCMQATEFSQVVQDGILSKDELLEILLNRLDPALHSTNFRVSKRTSFLGIWELSRNQLSAACESELPVTVCQSILVQTDRNRFLEGFSCKVQDAGSSKCLKAKGMVVLTCTSDNDTKKQLCTDFTTTTEKKLNCVDVILCPPMLLQPHKDYILELDFKIQKKYSEKEPGQINIHNGKMSISKSLSQSCLEGFLLYSSLCE